MTTVDLLAIAAHRDDVELTCSGTLIKAAKQGYKTAIIDFTQGEMGSRGSAAIRAAEASKAAEIMGVQARENLNLPDAGIVNDLATRELVARAIRRFKPRIVIAPAREGRHPDHHTTAQLVRDACFVAGLAKYAADLPKHRPKKLIHCLSFREDFGKPTFVVDITEEFETKMKAIRCYDSQFSGAIQAGEVLPNGEPFHTLETMRVDDIVALEVSSF